MLRVPGLSWLKRATGMGRRGALARTPVSPAGAVSRGGVSDLVSEFFRRQMRLGADRIQRFAEYEVMDEDDLPSSILDLYAEDATQIDHATGRSVWLTSKNEIIAKLGEEFLRDVLRIEDNVFGLARDTAKYGVAYDCPLQEEDAKTGLKGPMFGSVPLDPKIVTPVWDEVNRLIGYRIGLEVGDSASKDKPAELPWSLVQYMVSGRDRTGKGGTSVFQPARRPFRRLRMVEDSLILLRLKIAPDRLRFKIKNSAEFSPEERRSLMQEMRDEIRKKRLIDPTTGEVRSEIDPFTVDDDIYVDDEMVDVDVLKGNTDLGRVLDVEYARKRFLGTVRVPPEYVGFSEARGGVLGQSPLCLTGDTLVPLADGRVLSMEQLAAGAAGDEFWVYAVDPMNHRLRPGVAHSARLTKQGAPVLCVVLDNGESFRCTSDHPVMLRDGSYKPAGTLCEGDSVMPFYKRGRWVSLGKVACNHKIVSVAPGGVADVYDLSVDGHHNFALACGAFVHNCQIDIQFSRSCKRIQRAVITGLVRAFQIDLCWRGINPYKPGNEFEIHMVPISFLEEKQRAETAKMRAEAVEALTDAGDRLGLPKDEWAKYVLQVSGLAADLNRFNPEALALDWQGIKPAELLAAAVRLSTGRKLLEDVLFPGYMSSWHLSPAGLPPVAAYKWDGSVLTEGRTIWAPSADCVRIVKAAAGVAPIGGVKRPQSLMEAVVEGTS